MPEAGYIEFETPENVMVRYQPAGLGTRFLAWLIDYILLLGFLAVVGLVMLFAIPAITAIFEDYVNQMEPGQPGRQPQIPLYFMGLVVLIFGLSSFLYYGLFELLLRGQTPAKRWLSIRVVDSQGFSLNASAIFVRNIFRIIDHFPVFWIVPFVSKKAQRLGDMVAGTIVVRDQITEMNPLRERLLKRSPSETVFHFDVRTLQRARPIDVETVEKILERWNSLDYKDGEPLLEQICASLAKRLNTEPPPLDRRLQFLIDFLWAEYRRQYRQLG
jgi:uncharacterized RDD family membrane protein YckC